MARDIQDAQPYRDGRFIIKKPGYAIIFSKDIENLPITCPVCEYVIRTQDDEFAMNKVGACNDCMIRYAHRDLTAWNEGVRPERSEIDSQSPRELTFKLDIP